MFTAFKAIEWTIGENRGPYADALSRMDQRVDAIRKGEAAEEVCLLEHPPLYTAGTSAKDGDLVAARFPVELPHPD